MRHKTLVFVSIFCVFALIFHVMPAMAASRGLGEVQQEIQEQKDQLKALQDRIAANKNNVKAYQQAIEEYKVSLGALLVLIDEQAALVQATEDEFQLKSDQLSDANIRIQNNRTLYEQRLRAIYEMNSTNAMLANLLAVESYSEFVQRGDAMKRVSRRDTAVLEQLAAERTQLEATRAELEASIETLRGELAILRENRQFTEDEINRYNGLITGAEQRIELDTAEAELTEEEIKELQQEAARIFREMQAQGSRSGDGSVRYGGPLQWPVPGYSRVSSWYGDPRSNTRDHYGIDIPAPTGTPIAAAAPGTVITSQWNWSYGWYLVVDHGGGFKTLYAHCYQLGVPVGTYVAAGDAIAGVGDTGNSYGAHLHFEVTDGGSRQDPAGANYLGIY